MEKANAAVSEILANAGHNDTTVSETVAPAVINEHITRTQLEEAQKVVDREVHQDHFHTTVQPVQDQEVLPERHTHHLVDTEHREITHGNGDRIKQTLEAERAQFKDTREVGETQFTSSAAPTVAGEHVHHHIHETIQPVVQKEVIEPSVVHTTIPVHEIHHKSVVEDTTSLPTLSMAEYKSQGGPLTGSERRRDSFEGPPEHLGKALDSGNDLGTIGGRGAEGTTSLTGDLEPKVGPNRGNTPATNAQRNVAEREANTTGMTGTTGTTGMTTTTETTGTTGTTGTIGSDTTSSTLDGTGHETPVNTNYDNVYTKPGDSNTVDHETTTPVKKEGLLSKIKHALE